MLVTSDPIQVSESPFEIVFEKPIVAYNKYAVFHVDISELVNKELDYLGQNRDLKSKFPEGCISIHLKSETGGSYPFSNKYAGMGRNNPSDVWSIASATDGLPNQEYISLTISSCIKLNSTEITWFNYGKV